MRRPLAEAGANVPIPVRLAGQVIGKGKSTIYAWIERGILTPSEGLDGMTVTPAQLRAAEASIVRGRPAAKMNADNAGNVG